MSETENKTPKPPKGTPKGGARFPRYSLKDALPWIPRLVSKTHLGPQSRDIISASVAISKGATAEIKISALRQFGIIDGPSTGYVATDLAKSISNALPDELLGLYSQAALSPLIFSKLFETFHGDEVSTGKLRQRAGELNVHPDNLKSCVDIYVDTLEVAGLVSTSGDKVTHQSAISSLISSIKDQSPTIITPASLDERDSDAEVNSDEAGFDPTSQDRSIPRAIFNVTVNLDSSLDTEKLEKQLALLKRFGAI